MPATYGVQYQQYTDDTQLLRLVIHADNTSDGLSVLAACTVDVKQWYMQNGLQLNPDKSEALIVGTANQLHDVTSAVTSVYVAGVDLSVANDMKALGVVLDRDRLTFRKRHGSSTIVRLLFSGYPPYTPSTVHRNAVTLHACSLILTRVDYCNSVLYGAPASSIQVM